MSVTADHQTTFQLHVGDSYELMSVMGDNSVDLVMGSPPYHGKMNRYGTRGKMTDVQWAEWMTDIVRESVRISRGGAIFVANGCVKLGRYKPSIERLVVACDDAGIRCERPVIWHKNAPPNRRDWFANHWEYVLAFGQRQRFNWEAIAKPPKFKAGGNFRQRTSSGKRVIGGSYPKSKLARPGDVLRVTVGGGHMGHALAHENEAPYPEKLVQPFVLTLTDPGMTVLDPFCGSGTTLAVALKHGRSGIGIDNRKSQVQLSHERIESMLSQQGAG